MSYKVGENGLLDFSDCETDEEKLEQCWHYFEENLSNVEITSYDQKLVRGFTEVTFNHIVSASSNKYDKEIGHDIPFDERRAECLPLLAKVIRGEIRSSCFRVTKKKGSKTEIRKNLVVVDLGVRRYVVSMTEVKNRYMLLTAFPTNEEYVNRCIRAKGTNMGFWG